MIFDPGTIKHLGLQMYSTLPPVLSELVSNAWDAGATEVNVNFPQDVAITDSSEIIVADNGDGMSDERLRDSYLIVGRDRREADGTDVRTTPPYRPIMGRKGIGKFAGFGVAAQVEIETMSNGEVSRFIMNYADLEDPGSDRTARFPSLPATGEVTVGTKVTLRNLTKYRSRAISSSTIRRALARRFSVIGEDFKVLVNGTEISPDERDLKRLLAKDHDGQPYLWTIENEEILPETGWRVSGWIGALPHSSSAGDEIQRGIVIMARGKLVQEPFVFDATVGQQYALAYLVGEVHAEFVDQAEDTISTARNSLVWDTEANAALLNWGKKTVNQISREWAQKRAADNEANLLKNPTYTRYLNETKFIGDPFLKKISDKLIKQVAVQNVVDGDEKLNAVVEMCIDYLKFDSFRELATLISESSDFDIAALSGLFSQWQVVEAKEMAKVTNGRVATIRKLQSLIDQNALEVPILHNFLKDFPWVLDPKWHLVDDEVTYSNLLKQHFSDADLPEVDRRIDFLCVRENDTMVIVEIKRPQSVLNRSSLNQIEEYVQFLRTTLAHTTDPELRTARVVGYLFGGSLSSTSGVLEKARTLQKDDIFVRLYKDLLSMVERSHEEFLRKYEELSKIKQA